MSCPACLVVLANRFGGRNVADDIICCTLPLCIGGVSFVSPDQKWKQQEQPNERPDSSIG